MAITPTAPGEIQPPNSLTPDNAGSISVPNNLASESAGDITAPNTLTPDSVGAIDTPNSLGANTAGSVGVPNSLSAESSGAISTPNSLGAESVGSVSAPNALSSETVGDIQPPNVLAPDTVGQIAIPNVLAAQGATVLPRTLRPLFELNFASQIYADCNEAVAFNDIVTYTRASSGTYIDRVAKCTSGYDYILKTAGNDEARFEYDPETGESLGLLIEGSSTNDLLHSEDFTDTAWQKLNTVVITGNTSTSPDGSLTADTFDNTLDPNARLLQTISNNSAVSLSFSLWIKAGSSKTLSISIVNQAGTSFSFEFDCEVTSEWQRFSVSGDSFADNTGVFAIIGRDNSDQANDFQIWGAQLEESPPFASSYIKTTTSSATRAADDVTYPAINKQPEKGKPFTVVFEVKTPGDTTKTTGIMETETRNQTSGIYLFLNNTGFGKFSMSNGASLITLNAPTLTGSFFTGAFVYDGTVMSGYIDGIEFDSVSMLTPEYDISELIYIGGRLDKLYGNMPAFKVYDIALTSAEIAKLAGV